MALNKLPMRYHDDDVVYAAIRQGIPEGGVFWDYLTLEARTENFGMNEYERGVIEGCRRFAIRLQDIVSIKEE